MLVDMNVNWRFLCTVDQNGQIMIYWTQSAYFRRLLRGSCHRRQSAGVLGKHVSPEVAGLAIGLSLIPFVCPSLSVPLALSLSLFLSVSGSV